MRRWSVILTAVVVLACAGYSAYWVSVARSLEAGLAPWAASMRARHDEARWRSAAVEGFPWRFRFHFTGAEFRGTGAVPFAASADKLVATAAPFDLQTWHVAAPDGARIDAPSLRAGVNAAALNGTLVLDGGGRTVQIAAHDLSGNGLAQGFAAADLDGRWTAPAAPPASHRDAAFTLAARLDRATVGTPPALAAHPIDVLSLAATFRGKLPPGPLATALAVWRDDGGSVDLDDLHAEWNGTIVNANGTITLDAAMQPEGAFTAAVTGADKTVDSLVASGVIEARYAGIVKSVLRAITAGSGDGKGAARLPLTIQDQRLYIGPAPVAVLPTITWP